MTNWEKVKHRDELIKAAKTRSDINTTVKVPNGNVDDYIKLGYQVVNPGAKKTELKMKKKDSDYFEDTVWSIFYKMGFDYLNEDNSFVVEYKGNSKQIDVLAIDEETVFVIECKCAAVPGTKKDFKVEIEAIHGYENDVKAEILSKFPNREVKFCFATKNYVLIEEDQKRLKTYNIAYFGYETISYYKDLTSFLGTSAKYQLQGNVFSKQSISALQGNKIPAIKGEMGNKTYYMFAIEPKKLLKLAYILHRHTANIENFPTYQRIIKKDRLASVTKYIKDGGYFPNSLIISIDGEVSFDALSNEGEFGSQVGILELPNVYSTMYVIDGQHRLYGYSDKTIDTADVIPVVAFVNMSKEEQVKIFMDINENQKSVSKALRNTLIVDMNWNSSDPKKAQEALMIKIAESLGESQTSPLFDRVKIGESSTSDMMSVTTEMIKNAIKDTKFLNVYNKGNVKVHGTFDKDSNDKTYKFIKPFLEKCLNVIKNANITDWNTKGHLITKNAVIYSQIRIIDNIVNIKLKEQGVSLVDDNIFDTIKPMLDKFATVFQTLDAETKAEMNTYGDNGKKRAYEALAVAFNSKESSFIFPELEIIIDSKSTKNNEESKKMINDIENYLKDKFKNIFGEQFPLIGKAVTTKMFTAKAEHDQKDALSGIVTNFDMWDVVSFEEMAQIIKNGSNWSTYIQSFISGCTKQEILDSLDLLKNAKDNVLNEKPITTKNFNLIKDLHVKYGGVDAANN